MSIDSTMLRNELLSAAKDALKIHWPIVRHDVEMETDKIVQTIEQIEKLASRGAIKREEAMALLEIQFVSLRTLLKTEGISLINIERAVSAFNNTIARTLNLKSLLLDLPQQQEISNMEETRTFSDVIRQNRVAQYPPSSSPHESTIPSDASPVQFTVYYPQELLPNEWSTFLTYIHIPEAHAEVEEDSKKRLEQQPQHGRRRVDATQQIARGAEIVIIPELPGCVFNPPQQQIVWLEDWHRAEFRVQASTGQAGFETGKAVNGRVAIYVSSVLVGEVPIWTLLTSKAEIYHGEEKLQTATAKPYEAIFVSYSHKDAEIVKMITKAYKVLGSQLFRDEEVLRSGEEWDPRLLALIEHADVFQLYWSNAAKDSSMVKHEWQHALKQNRANFVRPVYWRKPMPGPPPELANLHFAYYEF